jgi:hypothetical protein
MNSSPADVVIEGDSSLPSSGLGAVDRPKAGIANSDSGSLTGVTSQNLLIDPPAQVTRESQPALQTSESGGVDLSEHLRRLVRVLERACPDTTPHWFDRVYAHVQTLVKTPAQNYLVLARVTVI